jgi:hypothetical protein
MYDVIECFSSMPTRRLLRLIVEQSPSADSACLRAEALWRESNAANEASTFVVVDRSTTREVYRIPEAAAETEAV